MAKIKYDGITFDSELEVEYYKYLLNLMQSSGKVEEFNYHPKVPIQITRNNFYTPDFIVAYTDRIEIIETKGYNPYSKMRDDMIHEVMKAKTETELRAWLGKNNWIVLSKSVVYRKIKYLKAYGFVDWDFKNPNTIANKRKEKITDLTEEVKELKEFKKNMLRYLAYHKKIVENQKLTKSQKEWYYNYVNEINKLLEENK